MAGALGREGLATRRLLLLSVVAAFVGLAGGGAAYLLIHLIGLLTNLALFHRVGWQLPSLAHLHRSPNLVVVAAAGGLAIGFLAKWDPNIRGHGVPEAMEAVLTNESRIRARTAVAKPISAAIAIGTGGPFGAEGPVIVTGGALGSLIGQVIRVSPSERKILLACGAAAGMAATFGAPVASAMFAIELLLFEFSSRALVPLVVSSTLAAGVHSALFGTGPLFVVPTQHYAGLGVLPLYALLGALAGGLAVVINKGEFILEGLYARLPGELWHPVIGAVGFALVGLAVPRALGVGYDEISAVLGGQLGTGTVVALVVAKLVAWWVSLASGTSGGTLAPLLLIGASSGWLFGTAVNRLGPGLGVRPGAFALVAMAACFGASIRAPFSAIVFVFEITRSYQVILPLMLATVLAELVVSALMRESLMTEKLSRRGLRVVGHYEADVMVTASVGDVMTGDVQTLQATSTVGAARRAIEGSGHDAHPLVDGEGRCVGMVSRKDLLGPDVTENQQVGDVARDPILVSPDDTLRSALQQILESDLTALPVVDDGRLVGICTRTDILRARLHQFEQERVQEGWRPAFWTGVRRR